MVDQQSEDKSLEIRDVSHLCDSLVALLSSLKCQGRDIAGITEHLSSLGSLLRASSVLETHDRLRRPILDCAQAIISAEDFLKAYSKMEAAEITGSSKETLKQGFAKRKSALVDAANALSLSLYVFYSTDELKNATHLKTLKSGLDKLSEDVVATASDIFIPAATQPSRETKFLVQELELAVPNDRAVIESSHVVVCPNASLPNSEFGPKSKVKFLCSCDSHEQSHDGKLEYQVLKEHSRPVEVISPGIERTWDIVLLKPSTKSIVSVQITKVEPAFVCRMRKLMEALALRFVKNNKLNLSKSDYAFLSSDSLLLLGARCNPYDFPRKLPALVQFESVHGTVCLNWQPGYMQASHYISTPRPSSNDLEWKRSPKFAPQPHILLFVGHTDHDLAGHNKSESFTVAVSVKAAMVYKNNRKGPLWVVFSDVVINHDESRLKYSQISFKFPDAQTAADFAVYIEAIRHHLLQLRSQGHFSDEMKVYSHDSDALGVGSGEGPKTKISVITAEYNPIRAQQMRMVVHREGHFESLCLDFGDKALGVCQQGLQNSQDLVSLWQCGYNALRIPVIQQTNWHKLTSQRDKLALPRRAAKGQHKLPYVGGPQIVSDRKLSSDDWLDGIDVLRAAMTTPAQVRGQYARVKVCVIDTGFHPDDPGRSKVKRFKDFVNPSNNSLRDRTWHGTLCATIILSIYEECELFVARVFETNDTNDETGPVLMAEAIEWALEPEQDVDIISISAGFLHHSPRLQEAVQKASSANRLVFAAASNWGNLGPVAFPARHNLHAICVFSTDTLDRRSWFNPERRPDTPNFALLGEDWPHRQDPGRREHGTSMATAAAAGLAALIVDFSRHADNRQKIVRAGDVGKMLGMIAVFEALHKKAGAYKCVVPMKLLPVKYETLGKEQRREYMRDTISRAMEEAN